MPNAPGPFTTLDVMNNSFPCEGPKVVPLYLDFMTATEFEVDLKQVVQAQKISMVQSLFIDNADNSSPLFITTSIQNQRIVIPPGCQAYLAALFSGAQFKVTTNSVAAVRIFAQNFPVTNCVWNTATSSLSSVNVANFPVTQAITVDRSRSNAFVPTILGANLSVTTASQNYVMGAQAMGAEALLTNTGSGIVHVRFGISSQTAVVSDLPIMPGQRILIAVDAYQNMGYIGDAASTLNITIGTGGI